MNIEKFINIKSYASSLLTWICIPIVIIYNIAYAESGIFEIMIAIMAIMFIMLMLCLKITKDPITSLSFCYLNIGWLGLPIAVTLFGEQAAAVIIAAYVASSIFGNSFGASVLLGTNKELGHLIKVFKTPPVIALILGLLLITIDTNLQPYFLYPYGAAKWSMSFLGMLVLGIWMGNATISMQDVCSSLKLSCARVICFSVLISGLVLYGYYYDIKLITNNLDVLYFIGLLPPAANIIVLETHYVKTGKSAPIITMGTIISIFFIALYAIFLSLYAK